MTKGVCVYSIHSFITILKHDKQAELCFLAASLLSAVNLSMKPSKFPDLENHSQEVVVVSSSDLIQGLHEAQCHL